MVGSRKIPVTGYLKMLQLEYLSCKLREALYERPEFIKMNREIAKKKEIKIREIAKKFQLLCIFDSRERFQDFCAKEFFEVFGSPKLQYSLDPKKKKSVLYWDMFYLFKEGTIISYKGKTYKVKSNDPNAHMLQIVKDGKDLVLNYVDVKLVKINDLLEEI